ncbi:uncharacterized protein METZ01_LOCUS469522, partial [marine metagenome]
AGTDSFGVLDSRHRDPRLSHRLGTRMVFLGPRRLHPRRGTTGLLPWLGLAVLERGLLFRRQGPGSRPRHLALSQVESPHPRHRCPPPSQPMGRRTLNSSLGLCVGFRGGHPVDWGMVLPTPASHLCRCLV